MEAGKLTHSQSQPGGMDRTPPGTPKKAGKMLAVRVQMLDDTITMFQVQAKALGRVLFDQVCSQLHLLESDYFGLEYQEVGGTKYWLDLEKPLSRQIGLSLVETLVKFCVKFYTPDPSQLEEEFTRYLFCLQIKRDLSQGLLQCNNNTAALMASYIVQAECGDYVAEDYPDYRYLSSYKFVPNQDQELEKRIMENHKKHAGQSPAEADLNLLETARRCELYGIKMHPAKDHEGVPLNLAVAHMGIVVFQNFTKINTFSWAKIRKISFKRKRFLVKLHPEGYGYYKDTVEFFFEGRNECKNFWKKCVENHGFFRCTTVKKVPRQKTRVLSRGSSFRYSGRTQKQIVDFVRENYVKRQTFQRSQSFRHSSSAHSSVANVGTSISAHPLLPLGENAVAGTPASLSCGSMTLTSSPIHAADIHVGELPSPPAITSVSPGTSVTSSPQHFYPQENHYPRAGHQRAKVTHPHDHSHHGISPQPGSTNAVTPASTHSANHSNNNISNAIIDDGDDDENDAKTSRLASDYANFNDVYSNCYSSLRSLHKNLESSDFNHNKTKVDVETDSNGHSFLNGTSKSNESIRSAVKTSKSLMSNKNPRDDEVDWYRSVSYKDLYREDNLAMDSDNAKNLKAKSKSGYENVPTYKYDTGSVPNNRPNGSRLKNYSLVSKCSGQDRNGGAITDVSIYSKTYAGTASSLSTESAEEEPEDPLVEVFDVKYDSQEDMVLSHDDISHDSYELLERDPGEFDDEAHRGKNRRSGEDGDRARSCSWGSDRGMSPLNFRSTENVLSISSTKSRENGFWSLERERSPKHKSEGDFRSLDRKNSRGIKSCAKEEVYRSVAPINKRGRQKDLGLDELDTSPNRENVFDVLTKINQVDTEMIISKELAEKEYLRLLEREPWVCSQRGSYDQDRPPERTKYQVRKKSLEKCEPFLMKVEPEDKFAKEKQYRLEEKRRLERRREKKEERFHEGIKEKEQREWEKEKERRQLERKWNLEEKLRNEEEKDNRTSAWSVKDYSDFKEIHPKKFDRVVSNQFGKYSEFLTHEKKYDLLMHERKVMENYEKVCQVGKIAKELEMREKNNIQDSMVSKSFERTFQRDNDVIKLEDDVKDYATPPAFSPVQQDSEKSSVEDFNYATIPPPLTGKATVERTKSDPFSTRGNLRRNVLMHQKSIDLTPQHSEERDHYSEDKKLTKTSKSEHDIPYILHKRLMNGSPKHFDLTAPKTETKLLPLTKPRMSDETNSTEDEDPLYEIVEPKTANVQPLTNTEIIKVPPKMINVDEKTDKLFKNVTCAKIGSQPLLSKPPIGKKHPTPENKINGRAMAPKESKKVESPIPGRSKECSSPKTPVKQTKEVKEIIKIEKPVSRVPVKREEPIYAEVYRGKVIEKAEDVLKSAAPPHPPERTTSIQNKFIQEDKRAEPEKKIVGTTSKVANIGVAESVVKGAPESLKRPTPQKLPASASPKKDHEPLKPTSSTSSKEENSEELIKPQPVSVRGVAGSRRKESLILFARTRLGLSEGSAFTPVRSKGSPASQRRTKSLDAPYVSLNRLPPADAFSSKDDTVDGNDNDVLPPVERVVEMMKKTSMSDQNDEQTSKETSEAEALDSINAEVAAHFPEKHEMQTNIKKWTEGQSRVNMMFTEEKVLDSVRSKRLLSKIESVDAVDSEGDMDSSKLTDALPIPSDRIVNLPESVRFPSVRQISGQTSEESADGWDQREVKVKRRTPRRSVGRDEPEVGLKESVVWDSKDDEMPDDDVWDDNLVFPEKFEGSLPAPDAAVPVEYLKRGSCGQSIDDDNLSTPMKESSPEHWVSVDDLPEAIEREERMLRQQEKILREKILNEKLKRELNLDTIDVDEKMYEYKVTCRQIHEEEVIDFKGKFKGHSLDTYELTEKRLREKATSKYCSLDEHILKENPIKNYVTITSTFDDSDPHSSESMDTFPNQRNVEYIKCKVVNDLREIDSFSVDNDEELEEFFVVLDEKSENEKDIKNMWENENELIRTNSKDESVISVPEEFRDDDDLIDAVPSNNSELVKESELKPNEDQTLLTVSNVDEEAVDADKLYRILEGGTGIKISSQEGSRRGSFDTKMLPVVDDAGRLSPRRNSNDPRRSSASDEPDRLSPLNDSRAGGDESRRLSSEDSRKYSMSESVSEETRRRLSSTEETRRKRASLTKQCSVGADSLTDEMVSGVPECNSSFEHDDEKDVFEAETPAAKPKEVTDEPKPGPRDAEIEGHKEVLQSATTDKKEVAEKTMKNLQLESIKCNTPLKNDHVPDKACEKEIAKESDRVHVRQTVSLPDNPHQKVSKTVSHVKSPSIPFPQTIDKYYSISTCKSSFDSSQDSDIDKLSEVSIICHVQNQISRRNLSEAGKYLRSDVVDVIEKGNLSSTDGSVCRTSSEERGLNFGQRHSSDELEKTESSSFEGKPSPDECGKVIGDKKLGSKSLGDSERTKGDGRLLIIKERRTVEDKRDSGEDGSSSSSAPPHPKRELSSTWKPFLLESSGSSSLEENWLPPDDNAHLADEEETSSTSNNPQDESGHEDLDYPTGIGYPVVNASSAEMIVGGYGGVYALSRTLSRISERSTSEQERSDMEDDFTKPSSHSVSAEEESMLSSDRQPSLSSDPPSLRGSAARIPDLPDDRSFVSENATISEEKKTVREPFGGVIPPPLPDEDWPSPPPSACTDTPVTVSHVETVYLEIYPEEACKVVVAETSPHQNEGNSSSDENHTLQEEGDFLHLSSDNISMSTTTTTTTQDGTVVLPGRRTARAASVSEDTSLISVSEWSSSTTTKPRANSTYGIPESELSDRLKCSIMKPMGGKHLSSDDVLGGRPIEVSSTKYEMEPLKMTAKMKPPKLRSPTGKIGFFETPVSKVRSPTSQSRFFEPDEAHVGSYSTLRSPTSRSEASSPKNCKRFFESPIHRVPEAYENRGSRNSLRLEPNVSSYVKCNQGRPVCTPYYSNVTEGAEKSFFGRYDTGSLERTKIIYSRKCRSYYSMTRTVPDEEDSSNSEERQVPSSNTIPRASKKKKRHRVAMDLEIRDGKIVAPPKTRSTIVENTDSDRSSPRQLENSIGVSENSIDVIDNYNVLSSTPIQNGKVNGEVSSGDGKSSRSGSETPLVRYHNSVNSPGDVTDLNHSETLSLNSRNDSKLGPSDSFSIHNNNSFNVKANLNNIRNDSIDGSVGGTEIEVKKKRYNADKGYFMIKELLSTERTYKKNLDVINKWFHEEVSKAEDDMPDDVLNGLFNLFDPLNAAHSQFLRDLEQRLATWEGKSTLLHKREIQKVGDIILLHFNILPLYVKYLDKHLLVLERLDAAFRKNKKFEQVYRDFELQRVCYLPLSSFIMKPLQKLLHYHCLLKRMINHYGPEHLEHKDFSLALKKLEPIVENIPSILKVSENFVQLSELQRDMPSFEGLLQGGREFIRQGCLMKHSKKGFQQRMFFLFSDILVYTNRCTSPILQFKVNGQMPLRGVMIEESDDKIGTNFSFTIYGGNRTLVVAASSQDEKDKWLKDLYEAVQNARERNDGKTLQYLSLKSCSSSDEIMDAIGDDAVANKNKNSQQRSNTTVHVCWHRNTSTSLRDHLRSYENELSGFLLRKFKNSNGWQKLWVVFANFCLFFYKAYLDESPLASLPLLGYTVTVPDEEDDIRKDFVFKLQFKNHVYFFRAESDYTFSRWMEIISSATKKSKELTTSEQGKDES